MTRKITLWKKTIASAALGVALGIGGLILMPKPQAHAFWGCLTGETVSSASGCWGCDSEANGNKCMGVFFQDGQFVCRRDLFKGCINRV